MHDGLMARPHDGSRTLRRNRVLMGAMTMMLCFRALFPTNGDDGMFAFGITDTVRNPTD
jgi:hypothetical protein